MALKQPMQKREYRCMNCSKILTNPSDLYTTRFCSGKCKDEYLET